MLWHLVLLTEFYILLMQKVHKKRAIHSVRTTVQLNQLKTDKRVGSHGGCLVLEIDLLDAHDNGDVLTNSWDFDSQLYWNLYLN